MDAHRVFAFTLLAILGVEWAGLIILFLALRGLTRRVDVMDENRARTLAFFKGAMAEPAEGRRSRFVPTGFAPWRDRSRGSAGSGEKGGS